MHGRCDLLVSDHLRLTLTHNFGEGLSMRRPTQNFSVDTIAFTLFLLLTSTGLLMHFILPPGSGQHTVIWGLSRHQWGDIHFWIAMALVGTIILHLLLHWRWLITLIQGRKGTPATRRRFRTGLAGLFVVLVLGASIAPLVAPKTVVPSTSQEAAFDTHEHEGTNEAVHEDHDAQHRNDMTTLRGSMSLYDVEQVTGISVLTLADQLNLPNDVPASARLRDLMDEHGFSMANVRSAIAADSKPSVEDSDKP